MKNSGICDSIDNCVFIKTILMIFVIIGHSVNFWNGTWFTVYIPASESYVLKMLSLFVNAFHIYAFTLTSGYIFAYLVNDLHKYTDFWGFVRKKIFRLLVPYIFTCLLWVIPIAQIFYQYSLHEVFIRYILGTNPNQLWFLLMLFWDFVFAWLLQRYCRSCIISSIICILIVIIGIVGSHIFINYFCIWTACEYMLFFWIGYLLFVHNDLGFIISFVIMYGISPNGLVASVISRIMNLLGAVASFLTLQHFAYAFKWKKRYFLALSGFAMPMFLFHQQFIYFTIAWLNGKVTPYINAGINLVFSFCGALLLSLTLMNWKITRFMIGE